MKITLSDYLSKHDLYNAVAYAPFTDTDFKSMLTNWLDNCYGMLFIRERIVDVLETKSDYGVSRINNLLNVYKYKYEHLYNTTLLEYAPIENYNMTETSMDKNVNDSTTTIDIGQENNDFETTTSFVKGAETEINKENSTTNFVKGKESYKDTTNTTDTGAIEHEKKVAPFDSSTYNAQELNTDTYNNKKVATTLQHDAESFTDKNTVTNTNTRDSATYTDTTNTTNTETRGGRNDIHTTNRNDTTTHELKRSGNIGVTTSQQMLQSEREVAMFSFINIVAKDIIKNLCVCLY